MAEYLREKNNEGPIVKTLVILYLMSLGHEYLSLKNAKWDIETNIFLESFHETICHLNNGNI